MTRIGLLSDTHSYLDPKLEELFANCDELWHAGDIGNVAVLDTLRSWKPVVRAVWGNIDGQDIRIETKQDLWFDCAGMTIFMTHIGGYPGRYNRRMKEIFAERTPDVFICGHSHILKVMYDKKHEFLHINPGACGKAGFHHVRTALRFAIDGGEVKEMEVIELGKRGN